MLYLTNLLQQIAIFPEADIQKPADKRAASVPLLGEVPVELRKLWTVRKMKIKEHNTLAQEFNKNVRADNDSPSAEFIKQARILELLQKEIDLLENLFWFQLQKNFQKELLEPESSNYEAIGLYDDWTCGLYNKSDEKSGLFNLGGGIIVVRAVVR